MALASYHQTLTYLLLLLSSIQLNMSFAIGCHLTEALVSWLYIESSATLGAGGAQGACVLPVVCESEATSCRSQIDRAMLACRVAQSKKGHTLNTYERENERDIV